MEDLEDVKTLLDRIERNVKSSSMSDSDKKYLGELLDIVRDKLKRMMEDDSDQDS